MDALTAAAVALVLILAVVAALTLAVVARLNPSSSCPRERRGYRCRPDCCPPRSTP